MIGCVTNVGILENINGHDDLIKLLPEEQAALCGEIRQFLISHIAKTGGHLASNLGVVELTVAIETVFDTNKDRLVFDVGHQSYVHKLLTGRQADFDHLRQYGGIAGFPKPSESDADAFVAGHASSSVSIALGMARARKLTGQSYDVVALIGDGAATGGMVYEGLNDAGDSKEPMVIILNDNEMSIDRNVGGFARHLGRLRTKERYLGMKESYRSFLKKFPGGSGFYHFTSSIKNRLKQVLLPGTIFEHMGLTYMGPVDGHDLQELIRILRVAKDLNEPVLVHVLTQKGHGYVPAEEHPSKFHGVGKFDPETGEVRKGAGRTFSEAFGDTMLDLAASDDRICAITAAMPGGTGLLEFKEQYPDRLFDVGIAEEHAISMAGGLAKQGAIPVAAIYSTFLQRSFDQILQDVAMLKLHVIFAIDRAGLVGEDGETHHGVFDIGFLRQVPGMKILCPASCKELSDMLKWAAYDCNGPVAIRYPRGGDGAFQDSNWDCATNVVAHKVGNEIAIVTYGTMINNAMSAADLLSQQGIDVGVIRLLTVEPMPADALESALAGYKHVLNVEESATGSGIHEALAWKLAERVSDCKVSAIDLGNEYVTHGSVTRLYEKLGLDAVSIAEKVREVLSYEN